MEITKQMHELLTMIKPNVSNWEEFWDELYDHHLATRDSNLIYAIEDTIRDVAGTDIYFPSSEDGINFTNTIDASIRKVS